MTISKSLTPKRAKKVATNLTMLVDKFKVFSEMQAAAQQKEGAELEDAGFNILKKFLDILFVEDYDLIVNIIADLFGVKKGEAKDIPLDDIYDFIIKDKVVRTFFPRLALLDARAQSDISQALASSQASTPTASTLELGTSTSKAPSNSNTKN